MEPLIYAHRGASAQFAEHTRAAMLQALADGADGVECDVHLTSDGQLVCLHDPTVDRTSDGSGAVAELTAAQLRALDVSSWKGVPVPAAYGTPAEQLLTLSELLTILRGAGREVGIAIELKHPSPFGRALEDAVLAQLRASGWDAATSRLDGVLVSFMSFDPGSVAHLAEHVDPHHLCQLTESLADTLPDGVLAGPSVEAVRADPEAVRKAVAAGRRFRVWTVDAPADVRLLQEIGVQEITTNEPALVRRCVENDVVAAESAPERP
ncbi:glycerophosphodiester phosphodiesterase family protein [Pseudonocardia sp. TRM90224]|uniref:glycerophosphodiester phosphodiesterase family protein n=1 Tax=Pseudonocardia sp. TRM90224 TaxID=2812678 RepID=UPI001E413495|nr:glycerophosphodiester phosphodiesterase family protein [Pseudonocardia sp. TRM90224]